MKEKHKLADIPRYHPNPACRIKYFGMIFQIDMGYGHINSQDSVKEISYRHAVCVCVRVHVFFLSGGRLLISCKT